MLPPKTMRTFLAGILPGSILMSKDYVKFALLTGFHTWDSWLHPLLAAALRRVGPAQCLGSTVGLALVAETWVGQPSECEH